MKLDDTKLGDELFVRKNYFKHAYSVIFEIGFKLAHVLWRKFKPDERSAADQNLIELGYDTLKNENYNLTKMIFDFSTQTLKTHSTEERRCIMTVNRALAYKWSGNDKKAKEIVSSEDWSAASTKFKLAKEVILDNYDAAYHLMKTIGNNSGEVQKEFYRVWPLFRQIKNEVKYQEVFLEIFGEPYNKVESSSINLLNRMPPEAQT